MKIGCLDRTDRLVVRTCGNASCVRHIAVSSPVCGSVCRAPHGTCSCEYFNVLIFLSRICVCEPNSKHVYPAHIYDLCFLFGSFRLALKAPVRVRKFPNEFANRVSGYLLPTADHMVRAYYRHTQTHTHTRQQTTRTHLSLIHISEPTRPY